MLKEQAMYLSIRAEQLCSTQREQRAAAPPETMHQETENGVVTSMARSAGLWRVF
jgi:hypothetical protein